MFKALRNIIVVAYIEWLSITRDKVLTSLVFLAAFIYLTAFGLVYHAGILQHIPVAVADQDHSRTSREVVERIANSPRLKIVHQTGDSGSAEKLLQTGDVRAVVVIPENFEQDIKRGEPVRVSTEIDGCNLIYAYNLRKALADINGSLGGEIMAASLMGSGVEAGEAERILRAVEFHSESRYNPTYNYVNFLYLLLIIIALQQTCLLGEGLTLAAEKEQNTWIQFALSPFSGGEIFAGKVLPYYLTLLAYAGITLTGANLLLGLPVNGSMFLLLGVFAVFALAVVAMGFWISSCCRDTTRATMIICLFNIPMVFGSGLIWPFDSMAPAVRYIAYLFPYTWMGHAARAITLKGAGLSLIWIDLAVLGAMAVFLAGGAAASVRRMTYNL